MTLVDEDPASTRPSDPASDQPSPAPGRPRIKAYDGIRAVSLVAVLLFHADLGAVPGGFLGVSVFFTLSGFLITGLLVSEYRSHGRIALGRFWDRRFRRLLPAAAATIVGVAILAPHLLGYPADKLRPESVAAALDVANWRQLLAKQSYADLLHPGQVSPLLHFWSLAIEEQFYLVFPLVAAIALRFGGVRGLRRTVVALIAGSLTTIALCHSFNAAYYNTGARAAEILAGALLAIVAAERPAGFLAGGRGPRPGWHQPARTACGLLGLAALVAGSHFVHVGSPIFEQGFLAAFALASCLLIVAASGPGPVSRALAMRPLRWLGERSYAIYLLHWPIYLVIRHHRPGWPPLAVLAAGTLASTVLAALSYRLYEQPIRSWQPSGTSVRRLAKGLVVPAVAISLALVTASEQPFAPRYAGASEADLLQQADIQSFLANQAADDPSTTVTPAPTTAPPAAPATAPTGKTGAVPPGGKIPATTVTTAPAPPPPPFTVSAFGDSTSGILGQGLARWGKETGALKVTGGDTLKGCPLGRGGQLIYMGTPHSNVPQCDWSQVWLPDIRKHPNQVAVVEYGLVDGYDRSIPGDEDTFRHFGDPAYDDYMTGEVRATAQFLIDHGFKVVWVTPPEVVVGRDDPKPPPAGGWPESDPARMERFRQIIQGVDAELPGMATVDLGGYLDLRPGGPIDLSLRPDGIHLTPDTAKQLCDEWIGQAVVDAAASIPS